MLETQLDDETLVAIKEHATRHLAELEAEIEALNEQLWMATSGPFELPAIEIPAAKVVDEKLARQASLVSSTWSWTEVTTTLVARKTYGGAG